MNIHMDSKQKNLKNVSRPSSSASESKTTVVVSSKGNASKTASATGKGVNKTQTPAPAATVAAPLKVVRGSKAVAAVPAPSPAPVPVVSTKPAKGGATKTVEPVLVKAKAVPAKAAKAAPAKAAPAKAAATKAVPAKVEGTKKGGAVKTAVAKNEKVATTQQKKKAEQAVKAEEVAKAKAKTKKVVENVQETADDIEEQTNGKLRYFKLFYNDEICGRYCGKKPKQAANKAFSSIIKDLKKTGNETAVEIAFSIKECTRNSKHKEYKYIGQRQVLKEPVKVEIQNNDGTIKEIIYKYHNLLSKAPK